MRKLQTGSTWEEEMKGERRVECMGHRLHKSVVD